MFATIRHFLSLIRFSHTLFALPFALLAMLMAARLSVVDVARHSGVIPWDGVIAMDDGPEGPSVTFIGDITIGGVSIDIRQLLGTRFLLSVKQLLGILLCMVTARSAAMAFNRLADRDIDAGNPRTAGRHIPAGILSAGQVTAFAAACSAGFVTSTLLFLPNRLPLYLSVPVLLFLLAYSYMKRVTSLAHFWLGAALALSPMAAWIAIRGEAVTANPLDLAPAAVLGAAVLAWVAGFDMIYACQDVDFDRTAKLHSVPVRLGVAGALRLAAGCHFATIVALAALPLVYPPFGWVWWTGIAAVAVLLIYEHALVRPDDLTRVNAAFFHVNAVISLGLLAVGLADLLITKT
ncbi:MAG: putative 4-hydroxybenzoate polyprenyltransferase [Planctomycetales bacterium]|nr:putative 4-hydroxybenzoate polyprenyltransferase [Planctomycetales bacterium]